jgi:hypothetical protein
MKTRIAALVSLAVLAVTTSADAGGRCRTSTSGSVTYTVCESNTGKTECRASRSGTMVYTSCR